MFGLIITTKKAQQKRDMAYFTKGLMLGRAVTITFLEGMGSTLKLDCQLDEILKEKGVK